MNEWPNLMANLVPTKDPKLFEIAIGIAKYQSICPVDIKYIRADKLVEKLIIFADADACKKFKFMK